MQEMFCFQCQQTAHNTGCDGKAGVCGKKADTANYQDEVVGALIGLAQAVQAGTATDRTDELMLKGLFTTITNVNFNNETILQIKNDIEKEKAAVSTTHFADYDMAELWRAGEDVRSLKSLILFGLKGMAAYAYHARALGKTDPAVNRYFYEALAALGEEKSPDDLLKLVLKTGEVNLACMALLDAANTEAYGDPVPVTVPLTIEKGPFIVVSGHDLHDAACPRLPGAEKVPPLKGQLWHRMAEPADRVPQYPGAHSVYHQLPDAGAAKLLRPGVHHLGGLLPGDPPHRRGQGFYTGH